MIAIVVSRADRASEHIGERLLEVASWTEREDASRPDAEGGGTYYRREGFELRTFEESHLRLENADEAFGDGTAPSVDATDGSSDGATGDAGAPDLLVFASRHSGDTGPLLSAHFTGNFGPAEYGGEPRAFARACPNAAAAVLDALSERAPPEYDVSMECTHHGPTSTGVPSMFVELGSGDEQWDDSEGARAVARAILDLDGVAPDRRRQVVGLGGGHYAPRFTRVARETAWAVGHVASDWQLEELGDPREHEDVLARAFEASAAERALVDGDRPELAAAVADLGYDVVTETWLREVDDVDLDLVEALESRLSPVDGGLRFGARAHSASGSADGVDRSCAPDGAGDSNTPDGGDAPSTADVEIVDPPADLLAEAQGIDADAVREAVRARAVAFETAEGGSRVSGRIAVREASDREALLDTLVDLLSEKYDDVERDGGEVIARVTAFDPDRARTLGVPEGPKFGALAAGEAVTIDGKRIEPEVVSRERTVRFPLR